MAFQHQAKFAMIQFQTLALSCVAIASFACGSVHLWKRRLGSQVGRVLNVSMLPLLAASAITSLGDGHAGGAFEWAWISFLSAGCLGSALSLLSLDLRALANEMRRWHDQLKG